MLLATFLNLQSFFFFSINLANIFFWHLTKLKLNFLSWSVFDNINWWFWCAGVVGGGEKGWKWLRLKCVGFLNWKVFLRFNKTFYQSFIITSYLNKNVSWMLWWKLMILSVFKSSFGILKILNWTFRAS